MTDVATLDLALAYPYDRLRGSAALVAGEVLPMVRVDLAEPSGCEVLVGTEVLGVGEWLRRRGLPAPAGDRHLLLAYGANASASGLRAKLAQDSATEVVLALRAELVDFDVVHSAHLSSYGAVPATLQHSPGTRVAVHVLAVTAEQRRRLEDTEGNYALASLESISLQVMGGPALGEVAAFISRHGVLAVDSRPVALSAVSATGRRFPALAQAQVQERVRDLLAPSSGIAEFVVENASDPMVARRRTRALAADALAFEGPSWRVLGS